MMYLIFYFRCCVIVTYPMYMNIFESVMKTRCEFSISMCCLLLFFYFLLINNRVEGGSYFLQSNIIQCSVWCISSWYDIPESSRHPFRCGKETHCTCHSTMWFHAFALISNTGHIGDGRRNVSDNVLQKTGCVLSCWVDDLSSYGSYMTLSVLWPAQPWNPSKRWESCWYHSYSKWRHWWWLHLQETTKYICSISFPWAVSHSICEVGHFDRLLPYTCCILLLLWDS